MTTKDYALGLVEPKVLKNSAARNDGQSNKSIYCKLLDDRRRYVWAI